MRAAIVAACVLSATACASGPGATGVVPEDRRGSLYARPWRWTSDEGKVVHFDEWRGTTVVVATVYTSCSRTCPRTIAKLRAVDDAFQRANRSVEFVIVTLDPENDTVEVLRRYRASMQLPTRWHLLTGSTTSVSELTNLLGVHVLADGDHIAHESQIVVFDAGGMTSRTFACCAFANEAAVP